MKPLRQNETISAMKKNSIQPLRADKLFGLRERNKRDKLRRIRDAATELFLQKGFDDTTTRAIAQRAGVGLPGRSFFTLRPSVICCFSSSMRNYKQRSMGLLDSFKIAIIAR